MKTAIVTGWSGEKFRAMSALTAPLMAAYGRRHGHEVFASEMSCGLPAAWCKLPLIVTLLQDFDAVLWLDADIVVVDGSRDVFAEMKPGTVQAMTEHETPSGMVPNSGVWIVTRHMQHTLARVFHLHEDASHPWWEQAAVMRLMGYAVEPGPFGRLDTPTTLYHRTTFLGPEWNDHPHDRRRSPCPLFFHVTQYADRLSEIRKLCAAAR